MRSEGCIVLICASTGLAAQNYAGDGVTAHHLFNIPVIEEELKDIGGEPVICMLDHIPDRLELVLASSVIIWDEFLSCDRECFESIFHAPFPNQLRDKIIITCSDPKQIHSVGQDKEDVLNRTMFSSPLWERFSKLSLEINMRLHNPLLTMDERELQSKYADMIECIGRNEACSGD